MEKELYYTNNKLISKLNIYFDVNPSQFNDIMILFTHLNYSLIGKLLHTQNNS